MATMTKSLPAMTTQENCGILVDTDGWEAYGFKLDCIGAEQESRRRSSSIAVYRCRSSSYVVERRRSSNVIDRHSSSIVAAVVVEGR